MWAFSVAVFQSAYQAPASAAPYAEAALAVNDASAGTDQARMAALARDITWLRLLHVKAGSTRSEINTPSFFLSPQGRDDPLAELHATLDAYAQPWPADTNLHPRCMFPARYYWLSQHLALPGFQTHDPRCARLEDWGRFAQLRSVSVYLVSGYFGNPASTFGHALLKLNTNDPSATAGLMDISVNFGAMVPPNEPTPVYIYKGLFGGYQAGFSDKFHYTNDVVYGRTEFRDMWDYELDLTEAQRTLLVFHLAEVSARKFDYFFLGRNCGLRIAELIELATGRRIVTSAEIWYAPVEMFHALQAADDQGPRLLVRPPRFIPSAERVLSHEFMQLNADQSRVANRLISTGMVDIPTELNTLPEGQRLDVLDALLAYQAYRLAADGSQAEDAIRRAKDRVLLARLMLPARQRTPLAVPVLASPAQGHSPMLASLGLAHDRRGTYTQLQWAPFSYELNGFHGLAHGELAVFDTTVGIDARQRARLESFDAIRVRKLNTRTVDIEGESSLSWQVQLGLRRARARDAWLLQKHLSFGVGRAVLWQPAGASMTAFAMLDGSLQSGPALASAGPQLGLVAQMGSLKFSAQAAWRRNLGLRDNGQARGGVDATWRLSRDQSLRWRWEHDGGSRVVAAFQQYW
jgi:hypothetical protein